MGGGQLSMLTGISISRLDGEILARERKGFLDFGSQRPITPNRFRSRIPSQRGGFCSFDQDFALDHHIPYTIWSWKNSIAADWEATSRLLSDIGESLVVFLLERPQQGCEEICRELHSLPADQDIANQVVGSSTSTSDSCGNKRT